MDLLNASLSITASMMREMSYSSMRMGLYDPVKQLLAPNANGDQRFDKNYSKNSYILCIMERKGRLYSLAKDISRSY
jgi:hypothetical protein